MRRRLHARPAGAARPRGGGPAASGPGGPNSSSRTPPGARPPRGRGGWARSVGGGGVRRGGARCSIDPRSRRGTSRRSSRGTGSWRHSSAARSLRCWRASSGPGCARTASSRPTRSASRWCSSRARCASWCCRASRARTPRGHVREDQRRGFARQPPAGPLASRGRRVVALQIGEDPRQRASRVRPQAIPMTTWSHTWWRRPSGPVTRF